MVRMKQMCEEIAGGCYTIPEVGIDVDTSLVLFMAFVMEVCVCVCVCVCVGDLATAVHLSTQHIGNANTLCQVCV